jgi:hypothetical protein
MDEPAPGASLFGMLAEFDRAERLLDGVKQAREAGFRRVDAYSPFPIEGLADLLDFNESYLPWLTFAGGLTGAAAGFGLQVLTNLDFPLDIGNRPLISTPAFLLIAIELTFLFAVLFAIGGMLALNHLPRLHHPLFDLEAFHLASLDKFFLVVFSTDRRFDAAATRHFLETLRPVRVELVGHAEEPE